MGEPETMDSGGTRVPRPKWRKIFLHLVLRLLIFAGVAGYVRLRLDATDEAMHKAVCARDLSKVRWLIRIKPSIVNATEDRDAKGEWIPNGFRSGVRSVLFSVVENDDAEMVALLVSKGANLNVLDRLDYSPLAIAVAGDRTKAAMALLQCGEPIDPNAMSQAAWRGRPVFLDLFLTRGANPNCRDQWGQTPLIGACGTHSLKSVRLLLAHGADLKITNSRGRTPLHAWAEYPHESEVGQVLLAHGANLNVKDAEGYTVLSRAIAAIPKLFWPRMGQTEKDKATEEGIATIRMLLESGADPNLDPRTLTIAKGLAQPPPGIVEQLIAHGAK